MNNRDALVLVLSRNAFYRRLHYLVFAAFMFSLITIAVLISVVIYLLKNPVRPLFFATDNVGRLIHVVPINMSNMSPPEVVNWTIEAAEAAYSYDYVNFRNQLQDAQKYFTTYGWNNFMTALSASNNLVALRERQMVVVAQVVDQPQILSQGLLSGAAAWKFKIPMLVTYSLPPYDNDHQFSNALNVTVIVQRQQALQGYQGLGVVQMIGSLVSSTNTQPQELSATPTS